MSLFLTMLPLFLDALAVFQPWLRELIARYKGEIMKLAGKAVKKKAFGSASVDAAPTELKDLFVAFLTDMKSKSSGVILRLILSLAIKYAPSVIDQFWDKITATAADPAVAPSDTAVTFGAAPSSPESVAFADCCEDIFK